MTPDLAHLDGLIDLVVDVIVREITEEARAAHELLKELGHADGIQLAAEQTQGALRSSGVAL